MKTKLLPTLRKTILSFILFLSLMIGFNIFAMGLTQTINIDFTGASYSCSDGTYKADNGSLTFPGGLPANAVISSISANVDLGANGLTCSGTSVFTFNLNSTQIGTLNVNCNSCANGTFNASTVSGYSNTGTNTFSFASSGGSGFLFAKGVYKVTLTVTYTLPPVLPTVTSFLPSKTCMGSGELVTITGTNFTGATSVTFNGVSTGFTVVSATQITATVPPSATSGTISVTTPAGTGSSAATFTVNALPTPPTASGTTFCSGTTATLSAFGAASGEVYKWYDAASGGNLKKTSLNNTDNTYTTITLNNTTNYWITIVNTSGCESNRTMVTATLSNMAASVSNHKDISCNAGSDGEISILATGGTGPYSYSVDNGANYTLSDNNPFTYRGLVAGTPYKVRVKDIHNCESPIIP